MVRPKKPIKDETLKKWLTENFTKETTQRTYLAAMRAFKKNLKINDLGEYLKSEPNSTEDIKRFLVSLKGRPTKTISAYVVPVRVFFQDHNVKLEENGWRKLRRRGFIPKRIRALTRDKKPTRTQLKQILNYADIKARSLFLFLLSSGARIGETLQLEIEDFDLKSDPPKVYINDEITKGGIGGRTAYFSYEAQEALEDWVRIKDTMGKRDGKGTYKSPLMFPFSDTTASLMWNMACDKAGLGIKDKRTNRRIYHLHSLRTFFRSKIGLDTDTTHALMGHTEYLDESYVRKEHTEMAEAYREAIPNVNVYATEDLGLKQETMNLKEENKELREIVNALKTGMKAMSDKLKNDFEILKQKYARLESTSEATALLYKQLDPKELEKMIREIMEEYKLENG